MSTEPTWGDPNPASALTERVSAYVGLKPGTPAATERAEYVRQCTTEATALIAAKVDAAKVPPSVWARAVVEVAADLYHRQAARNGVVIFDGGETGVDTVRIGADPLRPAWPLLRPYLGPVIA